MMGNRGGHLFPGLNSQIYQLADVCQSFGLGSVRRVPGLKVTTQAPGVE